MRILKISLLLILICSVTACGFKLRGQSNASLDGGTVFIVTEDNFHPVVVDLNRQLLRLGVISQLTTKTFLEKNTETDSSATLISFAKPKEQRKILSVDDTGRALEYELSIEIDVLIETLAAFSSKKGAEEAPSTMLVRRVLVYDNNQLLAKSREREKVREEMYRVLVGQLIERLRAQGL